MPSTTISKQVVLSHITDITKSLTVDLPRFSRMVSGKGKGLGSFEQRIAGIKKLCNEDWFLSREPQFSNLVLAFVEYVEAGQPIWCELTTGSDINHPLKLPNSKTLNLSMRVAEKEKVNYRCE